MADTDQLFTPFTPTPPAFESKVLSADEGGKKKRKARGERQVKPKMAATPVPTAAPEAAKTKRKVKRVVKRGRRKAEAPQKVAKMDVNAMLGAMMGLKPSDSESFQAVLSTLQSANKAARARILEAVGKLFG